MDVTDILTAALDDARAQHGAAAVFDALTTLFVSLALEHASTRVADVQKRIFLDGGHGRDITIHEVKDTQKISNHLPPSAREQLIRATQTPVTPADPLARVRAVEAAITRVRNSNPSFFKPTR